jgi:hypothetical protein
VLIVLCFGLATLIGRLTEGGSSAATTPARVSSQVPAPRKSRAAAGRSKSKRRSTTKPRINQTGAVLKSGVANSFSAFARSQPGRIGIAVHPVGVGREITLGDDQPAHGWSTTKPLVLAALLKATAAHGGLTESQLAEASAAITISDNQSIIDLFDDLGALEGGPTAAAQAMDRLLRDSGDARTVVATSLDIPAGASTTFGQTLWAPKQAAQFYAALGAGCLISRADTDYLLGLMQHIEASESWGLGSAGFRSVAFKGGWGPQNGDFELYLVRQSGVIDPGTPYAVAVSIVAHPPRSARSFEIGTEMVTATARWLAKELTHQRRASRICKAM